MAKKTKPGDPATQAAIEVSYQRDVKPFDDSPTPWTDAEIAYEIGGQTLQPIDRVVSKAYHGSVDWWYLDDRNGDYAGEFEALRDDPDTPAAVIATLKRVWQIIFGERTLAMETTPRTSTAGVLLPRQFSGQLRQFLEWSTTAINGTTTTEENELKVAEFYELGGGLKYPIAPAASDVAAARETATGSTNLEATRSRLNEQNQTLTNQYVAPVLQSDDPAVLTDANIKQAHVDIAANWVDGA